MWDKTITQRFGQGVQEDFTPPGVSCIHLAKAQGVQAPVRVELSCTPSKSVCNGIVFSDIENRVTSLIFNSTSIKTFPRKS